MPTLIKTFTSAQASGVKSYISTAAASSFSATTWTNVGTGASGATTTLASELPELTIASAIKVTNAGSGTGYMESVEFRIDGSDLGKKLAINYNFETSSSPAYVAGDFQIQIWDSTTSNGTYAQNTSVSTPAVPADTGGGSFTISYDQVEARPFTKLRVVRAAGVTNSWATFSSIQVTPGTITQGAALGGWDTAVTPGLGWFVTGPTNVTTTVKQMRDGPNLRMRVAIIATGTSASFSEFEMRIPSGLTIDATAINATGSYRCPVGTMQILKIGVGGAQGLAFVNSTSNNAFLIRYILDTGVNPASVTDAAPYAWNTTTGATQAYIEVTIPIAEWAGGTVNLGAGAQVEYTATSGTWDAASTTTVYGPAGQAIGGTLTAARAKTVTWQYPIQADDMIIVECSADQLTWVPLNNSRIGSTPIIPGVDSIGTEVSGAYTRNTSTTQTEVLFGRYANIANDDSPVANWPSAYWRVRKAKASSPVGFGLAKSGESGLINYYYEDDTTLAACTFQGNSGGSASSSIAIKITRIGRVVTLDIPSLTTIVPTTSSVALFSNTNLPTWARPAAAKSVATACYNGAAWATSSGYMYINTTGRIEFYRDISSTAFTNSANAGWYWTQITYTV